MFWRQRKRDWKNTAWNILFCTYWAEVTQNKSFLKSYFNLLKLYWILFHVFGYKEKCGIIQTCMKCRDSKSPPTRKSVILHTSLFLWIARFFGHAFFVVVVFVVGFVLFVVFFFSYKPPRMSIRMRFFAFLCRTECSATNSACLTSCKSSKKGYVKDNNICIICPHSKQSIISISLYWEIHQNPGHLQKTLVAVSVCWEAPIQMSFELNSERQQRPLPSKYAILVHMFSGQRSSKSSSPW